MIAVARHHHRDLKFAVGSLPDVHYPDDQSGAMLWCSIIYTTGDANVPVLGVAELIMALESDDTHGKPADGGIGSMHESSIRAMAGNMLEGGSAVSIARRDLYGI